MNPSEFKRIRGKLELTQEQMAKLLGFTNKQTVKNIEGGTYNPGKLVVKLLRYIDWLPTKRATDFIEEFNKHEPE